MFFKNLDVKMYPARGGVAIPPTPQLTKNIEDRFPVMLTLAATQEKAAPNCQDTKNPAKYYTCFVNISIFHKNCNKSEVWFKTKKLVFVHKKYII